jgi:hypothetical protein
LKIRGIVLLNCCYVSCSSRQGYSQSTLHTHACIVLHNDRYVLSYATVSLHSERLCIPIFLCGTPTRPSKYVGTSCRSRSPSSREQWHSANRRYEFHRTVASRRMPGNLARTQSHLTNDLCLQGERMGYTKLRVVMQLSACLFNIQKLWGTGR